MVNHAKGTCTPQTHAAHTPDHPALITFAVLCFTSTTRYVGTITLPTGVASSHPGILLRQRGFRLGGNLPLR